MYKCRFCFKTFQQHLQYKQHMNEHMNRSSRKRKTLREMLANSKKAAFKSTEESIIKIIPAIKKNPAAVQSKVTVPEQAPTNSTKTRLQNMLKNREQQIIKTYPAIQPKGPMQAKVPMQTKVPIQAKVPMQAKVPKQAKIPIQLIIPIPRLPTVHKDGKPTQSVVPIPALTTVAKAGNPTQPMVSTPSLATVHKAGRPTQPKVSIPTQAMVHKAGNPTQLKVSIPLAMVHNGGKCTIKSPTYTGDSYMDTPESVRKKYYTDSSQPKGYYRTHVAPGTPVTSPTVSVTNSTQCTAGLRKILPDTPESIQVIFF